MCSYIIQVRIGIGHALTVTTGLGGCHFRFSLHQAAIALDDKACGTVFGFRHILGNLRHAPLGGDDKVSPVFMQGAVE